MAGNLRRLWEPVRTSLWFIPGLEVLAAVVLAFSMVALDRAVGSKVSRTLPLVFEAGPDGARQMLGTIAGSVLTVAGVAFSFTLLAFSLASSQYSPRILHNFIGDRTNQSVLGLLLGSFVYCLLVLRTVRTASNTPGDTGFVPSLSVTLALGFALLDLGLFIFYLHHISISVTAYNIINRVGQAALHTVEEVFPDSPGDKNNILRSVPEVPAELKKLEHVEIRATSSGYVQEVDREQIAKLAEENKLYVEIVPQVGDYLFSGRLLARVSNDSALNKELEQDIMDAVALGQRRSQEHDVLFTMLQLSDVAIKALSPGVNDPTTALMCLDQIEWVLATAGKRADPERTLCDKDGRVCLTLNSPTFDMLIGQAFDQIRRYGAGDAAIIRRLLGVIVSVAEQTPDPERRFMLRRHALAVIDATNRTLEIPADRTLVNDKIAELSEEDHIAGWNLPLLSNAKKSDS